MANKKNLEKGAAPNKEKPDEFQASSDDLQDQDEIAGPFDEDDEDEDEQEVEASEVSNEPDTSQKHKTAKVTESSSSSPFIRRRGGKGKDIPSATSVASAPPAPNDGLIVASQKDDDDADNLALDDDEGKKRRTKRKFKFIAMISLVAVAALGVLGYLFFEANVQRVHYNSQVKKIETAKKDQIKAQKNEKDDEEKKRDVIAQATKEISKEPADKANSGVGEGGEATYSDATKANQAGVTSQSGNDANQTGTNPAQSAGPYNFGITDFSSSPTQAKDKERKSEGSNAYAGRDNNAATSSGSGTGNNQSSRAKSQRNKENSIYVSELKDSGSHRTATYRNADIAVRKENKSYSGLRLNNSSSVPAPVIPSFGSMLPVRTVGALYTLRSGSFVRMELTRDVKGDGWTMRRGTLLVGASKGNEQNRAFVQVVGFIDSQTGKIVRMSGDVMGGDGATGLKGKRHTLNGGWSKALSKIASGGVNIAGSILSGRGRDTVVISNGFTAKAVNPVSDEISAMIDSEVQRRQKGFVEVYAGTPGYVMVTDLPAEIKGVDAVPEDEEQLSQLSDVNRERAATGLSEREFAELLQDGSSEQIKAALPKMTPAMRDVALVALKEDDE